MSMSMSHHRSNSKLIDSVAHQLHSWKPFPTASASASASDPKPNSNSYLFPAKRPCRSDRSSLPPDPSRDLDLDLDLSRLNLSLGFTLTLRPDDNNTYPHHRWFPRKRRRRASRSVSGRSSDRSATYAAPTCTATATATATPTAATCSDSSGELMSWGSDVSEVRIPKLREATLSFAADHKEGLPPASASALLPSAPAPPDKDPLQLQANDSGYGSEPGYRGDAELGYGDEFDEDDDIDIRHLLFWGDHRTRGLRLSLFILSHLLPSLSFSFSFSFLYQLLLSSI